MKRFLFTLIQFTWGLPQTLLGAAMYLLTIGQPRFTFRGSLCTVWKAKSSVSLGLFIFVDKYPRNPRLAAGTYNPARTKGADPRLVVHEYGHCIQSLILGPFYLLLIGIPSFIWAMLPTLRKRRIRSKKSYYDFYTESSANYLAETITKLPSLHN